jgi:hypothetical protein
MHARNVYLVLNLSTGCVSQQYHCRFDDFFETTRHNRPDVNGTISWQLLAGLNCAETILSEVSVPTQHSVMYPETQSEANVPSVEVSIALPFHEFTTDNYSLSDGDSQVTENVRPSHQSWTEGATSAEPTVTAGTSQRGRVHTMSQRMAESVAQGLDHMAHQSTFEETDEDLFHDVHLELQERMRNPIAFHAEMMSDIMYLQQALRQPNAKEFMQAVVKEINGHVDCDNWTIKKRNKVPEDVHIVLSVWSMRHKRDLTTNEIKSHKA